MQRPIDLVRLRERMNPALRAAILKECITARVVICFRCGRHCGKRWS